jgi:pyruvate dehydrogenase E2 component (dihydrolipoamide acetyltransferase)
MNILMPQLGETVSEGTITTWYKSVGDIIKAGDSLFEIETDKTSMEVPSTVAGTLTEIRTPSGTTVPVGSVVAILQDVAAPAKPAAAMAQVAGPTGAMSDPLNPVRTPNKNFGPATLASGIKVTPLARRLAAQTGVDLNHVAGSGAHGRIMAKDIQGGAKAPTAQPTQTVRPVASVTPSATSAQIIAAFSDTPFVEVPLDGMRRTIAKRLQESKQTIPHFYLSVDVAMDRLAQLRSEANALAAGRFKLTINDFVIKALGMALTRVPDANAVWAEDRILRFKQANVGVAVAVEGGLFTPVIRGVESKSISVLSNEMKELARRARERALKPTEYQGGSITISNLGSYGVSSFLAIVNPPQSAILAVGAAERRPLEGTDGTIRFGTFMSVTLSCDHRVIDGALGAQLLAAFKALIESPVSLLDWT